MYIYTCICSHIHIHTVLICRKRPIYTYIYVHMCIYTCIYMYIHIYIYMYTYIYVHIYIQCGSVERDQLRRHKHSCGKHCSHVPTATAVGT